MVDERLAANPQLMRHARHNSIAVIFGLAITGVSAAQNAYTQRVPGVPPMLQRVDQSISDVSPLSGSLRQVDMAADLRSPMGYQQVFRVPGRDDLLMRANGAMYVIFPQSEYVRTKYGMTPVIPAGTIFSIGLPNASMMPTLGLTGPTPRNLHVDFSESAPLAPNAHRSVVQTQVSNRQVTKRDGQVFPDEWDVAGPPDLNPQDGQPEQPRFERGRATPPEPATFLKTVVTDDAVRSQRIAELLQQALSAVRNAG